MKRPYLFLLLMTAWTACGGLEPMGSPPSPAPSPGPNASALKRCTTCEELLVDLQAAAMVEVKAALNAYSACGQDAVDNASGTVGVASTEGDASGADAEDSGTSYTPTNLQEAGVDEADIVKTDGTYLYAATPDGVDIFRIAPASAFERIASYKDAESGAVVGMFLDGDALVVITSIYDSDRRVNATGFSILAVDDPGSPRLLHAARIDGELVQSRLSDGVLHVAVSGTFPYNVVYPTVAWKTRQSVCQGNAQALKSMQTALAAAEEENKQRIAAMTLDDWVPRHGTRGALAPVACVDFLTDAAAGLGYIGLLSMDLDDGYTEQVSVISGEAQELYASSHALYLANTWSSDDKTRVHRFAFDAGDELHAYAGSGIVAGRIDNSFSMADDAVGAVFRIATTLSGDKGVSNAVYTLDTAQADLPVLGFVDGIAPGETIYAVRYIGTTAYVVTYEQVDPLHIVDLSDPLHPAIVGELEVPGFSTYLHPLAADALLGLGKMTQTGTDWTGTSGLQLSLFNVSKLSEPTLTQQVNFGSWCTDSAALEDHRAFTLTDDGLFALPIWDCAAYVQAGIALFRVSSQLIEEIAYFSLTDADYPRRTIVIRSADEALLYVLDSTSLFQIDLADGYEVLKREALGEPVAPTPEPQPEPQPEDEMALCTATGGTWDECGSSCGPDAEACAAVCVPQCDCPSDKPYWGTAGCVAELSPDDS